MRKLLVFVVLSLGFVFLVQTLSSQTLGTIRFVNKTDRTCGGQSPCYSTIQAAVNAAQPRDTIRIQAGEYAETVLIRGKNNTAAATESDRIVIEADPAASLGSVLLGSVRQTCQRGDAIQIASSKFITVRRLTITDSGGQAVTLAGDAQRNIGIHLDANRIFGNGSTRCVGGVLIQPGNREIFLTNNLIYGNGRYGVSFADGAGGPYYVIGNTIHGNSRSGVNISNNQEVLLVNNAITGNGTDPLLRLTEGYGIRRTAPLQNPQPGQTQLINNLICGNAGGELKGPLLDQTDTGNLTPTGSEGQGVTASPGCQTANTVYTNVKGSDNLTNTLDDTFSLAAASPAIDRGADPRVLVPGAAVAALFTADFSKFLARPRDGDRNGTVAFDIGALEKPGVCEPGATLSCYAGPTGTAGVGQCRAGIQTCSPEGIFGPCTGQVLPSAEVFLNGIDEDCDGHDDECTPAAVTSCYSGPTGTAGIGICHAGTRTCNSTGLFGACLGQVIPATEIPNNGIDEDCNGRDAECLPGATTACYDGPPATRGVGQCHDGTKTCGSGGVFGACSGQALPGVEIPGNGIDEDCDGQDATSGGLPPDPVTVAPPINPSVVTTIAAATEFFYTGANPIQTGVAPDTIAPTRAAVLRGKVLDRSNAVLSGVGISILNHPEFGQTLSRTDGMFDLVVNGGGMLTVTYIKSGYLPAERQVYTPWQDYTVVDDVVLIQQDPHVTTVDLTNTTQAFQVAQGSTVTDQDGTRQATLLIPQGTQAQVYNPDGTTTPVSTLHLRLTEYTVGANGPAAMPGPLPPTSAYTYALEIKADEAPTKIKGQDVLFNQPVPFYVENFLGMPVGTQVPVAYFDKDQGTWIPVDDGRVIKILAITNSVADIDSDGDGSSDSGAALGITTAERQQLAQQYPPGRTLWRVSLTHLSTHDLNYGTSLAPGAIGPQLPATPVGQKKDDPTVCPGSIIECENQILGETLPITGTNYSLHYRSDRVAGRNTNTVTIPLIGSNVPSVLKRIALEITIAGQTFTQSFPANPNQSYTFSWDGKDATGRTLIGGATANVRIGYVYDMFYNLPPAVARSFGAASGVPMPGNVPARQEGILWQSQKYNLGSTWQNASSGLGGWSFSVVHAYDPLNKTLYRGDGSRRSIAGMAAPAMIETYGGTDPGGFGGDGGPATQAQFLFPHGLTVASDGSFFIADTSNNRIRRITPDGIVSTIAGTGTAGYSGDGGPATQAQLSAPVGVAVTADGTVFVTDTNRIRRIAANGIITTVAGTGQAGYDSDGIPATQAMLNFPDGVAVAADGSLLIADTNNNRIRRVNPDGSIQTIAGNGSRGYIGDGGPALQALLNRPSGVAVALDGSVIIADTGSHAIRQVTVDGIIRTVAGKGDNPGYSGDGGPAIQAQLFSPPSVFVAADGSLLISEIRNHRIRRVAPDGTITTLAGNGSAGFAGDGGTPTLAKLNEPWGVVLGPDNTLYINDDVNGRIRRVRPILPSVGVIDILIPSEDGNEVYQFDAVGRHIRTINAKTTAVLSQFQYDARGLLQKITDASGNITTIERDALGKPTAILAPFGQRSQIAINSDGYLTAFTNPANETYTIGYSANGLLSQFQNPRGFSSLMTYDSLGKLLSDTDAGGGSQSLVRSTLPLGYQVDKTSGLGRNTTYTVESLTSGDSKRSVTDSDGTVTQILEKVDGSVSTIAPDGSVATLAQNPDPRFGMLAPVASSTVTTAGLTATTTSSRTINLTNPGNIFSLATQIDTATINGRTYTSVFDASTLTFTTTSPQGRQAATTIDAIGRVTQTQVTGLDPNSMQYDNHGRLASITQGSRSVTFAYGGDGYLSTITDALGRITSFTHDAAGRVILQTLPDNRVITYSYDANGNLSSLTPPGQPAHVFDYTPVDLQNLYAPPSVTGGGTNQTTYSFNIDRDLTLITRPDGKTVQFIYDSAGRVSTQAITRGNYSYSYTPATGKLENITAPDGGTLTYSYNGSLLTGTAWTGTVAGNVTRTYDNNFRVTSTAVNGTAPFSFTYDNDSLLTGAGSMTLVHSPQNGLLTGSTLGGVSDSFSYNTLGEMSSYSAAHNGTGLYNTTYTRDNLGRITEKDETIGGVTTTFTYSYDQAGRLSEVKQNNVTTATYTYDANGNRLSAPNLSTPPTYDAQDRLLQYGNNSYSYTANGELLTKTVGGQTTSYAYDEFGNLVSVTLPGGATIEYVIDGQNRRIGKKVNGTLVQGFLYESQLRPVAELDGGGTIVSRFVYATGINVPDYMVKGGATYRILTDHLGSPRLVVDITTGTIVQRMDYDEFGNVLADSNPGFQPFGFAGGLYDQNIKLTRFDARDYDAETGLWTVKDPIEFTGGDTNLYGYVIKDPINNMDPTGLVDMNLTSPTDPTHTNLDAVPSPPGTFTVGAHGSPNGIHDAQGKVTAQDLANMIRKHPRYHKGMLVILMACNTGLSPGKGQFSEAQNVATALGGPVAGANNFVWAYSNGSVKVAPTKTPNITWKNYTPMAGKSGPDLKNPGKFITYQPLPGGR